MGTHQNNVTCSGGTTSVTSPNWKIRDQGGTSVTLQWVATGGNQWPASVSDAFTWKPGPNPGTLPNRVSDTVLRLSYTMPTSQVTWTYGIKLNNCAMLDPDVDNDPPRPDEDDDDQGEDENQP